jgi:hypothetical protein
VIFRNGQPVRDDDRVIFRNGQPVRDDDRVIFVAMTEEQHSLIWVALAWAAELC